MSALAGALNVTVGLLTGKFCVETTKTPADLTDQRCRERILQEFNNMKSNLNDKAPKTLLRSVHFLVEGTALLGSLFDKSGKTTEVGSQAEAVVHLDTALSLTQEEERLKVASEESFSAAKTSFKAAYGEATKAFSNKAFDTENRILATKLRIMSRILESLDEPESETAGSECLSYLKALHEMPEIKTIFEVYLNGGIKGLFQKNKRLEIVKSVTVINHVLFDFVSNHTRLQQGKYTWPGINFRTRTYYPIYERREVLKKASKSKTQAPFQLNCSVEEDEYKSWSAINSKGELIIKSRKFKTEILLVDVVGKISLFGCLPTEYTDRTDFGFRSLAIDGEDNVYIITYSTFEQNNSVQDDYRLFIFDRKGNAKLGKRIEFLNGKRGWVTVAVTLSKNIIISEGLGACLYVCDCKGELQQSFTLEKNSEFSVEMGISDKNEIIAGQRYENTVYLYTDTGKLIRTIELPKDHQVLGVAFRYSAKEIVVHTWLPPCSYFLLSYSETSELQTLPLLHDSSNNDKLSSHPNGEVALVQKQGILFV